MHGRLVHLSPRDAIDDDKLPLISSVTTSRGNREYRGKPETRIPELRYRDLDDIAIVNNRQQAVENLEKK